MINNRPPRNKYNEVQLAVIRRHPHFSQMVGYCIAWRRGWHLNHGYNMVGKKRAYTHLALDNNLAWITPLLMFSGIGAMGVYFKRRGWGSGWYVGSDGQTFYGVRARHLVKDENGE